MITVAILAKGRIAHVCCARTAQVFGYWFFWKEWLLITLAEDTLLKAKNLQDLQTFCTGPNSMFEQHTANNNCGVSWLEAGACRPDGVFPPRPQQFPPPPAASDQSSRLSFFLKDLNAAFLAWRRPSRERAERKRSRWTKIANSNHDQWLQPAEFQLPGPTRRRPSRATQPPPSSRQGRPRLAGVGT